jgi:hypothetical protein
MYLYAHVGSIFVLFYEKLAVCCSVVIMILCGLMQGSKSKNFYYTFCFLLTLVYFSSIFYNIARAEEYIGM